MRKTVRSQPLLNRFAFAGAQTDPPACPQIVLELERVLISFGLGLLGAPPWGGMGRGGLPMRKTARSQ